MKKFLSGLVLLAICLSVLPQAMAKEDKET
jgi:hypothetical protein